MILTATTCRQGCMDRTLETATTEGRQFIDAEALTDKIRVSNNR